MINLTPETSTKIITAYLLEKNILTKPPKNTSTEKPGEGNMNIVLRFRYDEQSVILKQSKPFVNKYPSIPAPKERIATEATYYKYAVKVINIVDRMPKVLHYDAENHLIVMEDLGKGMDYLFLYEKENHLSAKEKESLLNYLSNLHTHNWMPAEQQAFPDNMKLRQLNHQHIFVLPFQADNGFDLDQIQAGLAALAKPFTTDEPLKHKIHQLGTRYLAKGNCLLHGDYYPGSWMKTQDGLKIIDPEFSFMGVAEFELGVFLGHLLLCGHTISEVLNAINEYYRPKCDVKLLQQFAAVEIMRRLIGIAQLPLTMEISEKESMLSQARKMLMQ